MFIVNYEKKKCWENQQVNKRMWVDLCLFPFFGLFTLIFWGRAQEMWQELQASLDELPETRYKEGEHC
jgi:hypothetical protein